jgi:DHA2 family multidrug resistance protein
MSTPASSAPPVHRGWLTLSVMLATIMQAVDTTIANVALPHMQGSMGATQDQISWVLTSYIVASAICMPLTGFLAARWGRKRVFMASVVGFTITSMLCGAAQSLEQIVLFRLLQGVFGACLVPLSQSILLDAYPRERHGAAMALWGMGVMVGPILGPSMGGWLTEYYNWRWVFYINLPVGVLAWLGLAAFVPETELDPERRFDMLGFCLLCLGLGSLQMMLDRGHSLDWFASPEVVTEACLGALGMYLFVVHIYTQPKAFIDPDIFKDRNFSIGLLFIFIVGMILLTTMALLPPFLQTLMGYPVMDVGMLLAPRGIGTMLAMVVVGRLSGRVNARLLVLVGLVLTSTSLYWMTRFTTDVTSWDVVQTGILQGMGLGFLFVPFSTMPAAYRNDGTSLYSLVRNMGSSIGISAVISYLGSRTQINHAILSEQIHIGNWALQWGSEQGLHQIITPEGLSQLDAQVARQAAMLAFVQDFQAMMWLTLAAIPLLAFLQTPKLAKNA